MTLKLLLLSKWRPSSHMTRIVEKAEVSSIFRCTNRFKMAINKIKNLEKIDNFRLFSGVVTLLRAESTVRICQTADLC